MSGTATRPILAPETAPSLFPGEQATGGGHLASESHAAKKGFLKRRRPFIQVGYAAIDSLLVCLGGIVVYWMRFHPGKSFDPTISKWETLTHPQHLQGYPGFLLLYCALIILACISQHLYRTQRDIAWPVESLRVGKAVSLATTLLVLFIFTSGNKEISRLVVASAGVLNVFSLAAWRYAKRQYVLHRSARGKGLSRVLIVGAGQAGQSFASCIESHPHLGYQFCGFVDPHPNGDSRVLGSLADLRRVVLGQFIEELFVSLPGDAKLVKDIYMEARRLRIEMHVLPDLYEGLAWRAPVDYIAGFPALRLHGEPIPVLGLTMKRALDIVVSFVALILCSPFLALAAIWIRLDSSGPVIYSALRVGKKGRKFRCHKLRTMIANADAQKHELLSLNERKGPFFKMHDDPRITRCGRWLRKYSIDELPQLVNVLLGDMSLVGPRPPEPEETQKYNWEDLRRLEVRPGVTGLWQVSARNDPSFEKLVAMDLEYIEKWSLLLDLKILLHTIPAVLRAEGR